MKWWHHILKCDPTRFFSPTNLSVNFLNTAILDILLDIFYVSNFTWYIIKNIISQHFINTPAESTTFHVTQLEKVLPELVSPGWYDHKNQMVIWALWRSVIWDPMIKHRPQMEQSRASTALIYTHTISFGTKISTQVHPECEASAVSMWQNIQRTEK